MKSFFSIIVVLFTASIAQAEINTYNAKNHTCSELNSALNQEEVIRVKYRNIFGGVGVHFDGKGHCPDGYFTVTARLRASDGWCRLGYKCKLPPKEGKGQDED